MLEIILEVLFVITLPAALLAVLAITVVSTNLLRVNNQMNKTLGGWSLISLFLFALVGGTYLALNIVGVM